MSVIPSKAPISIKAASDGSGIKRVHIPEHLRHGTLLLAQEQSESSTRGFQQVLEMWAKATGGSRRMFVTSAGPGEGKTSMAVNLAWLLSQREESVLLVELNFVQPGLRSLFGDIWIKHGIDSVVRDLATPVESMFALENDFLHVAAVREPMRNADVKRRSAGLAKFLSWGESRYDWMILDCPSVLSGAWTGWLRDHADPALLVTQAEGTTRAQLRSAVAALGQHLKGVVLNKSGSAADHTALAAGLSW